MTFSPSHLAALSAEISGLASAAAPSLVAIDDRGQTLSGFLWRPDVIATASEALAAVRGETVPVLLDGEAKGEGVVIGHDPTTDLALIRIAKPGVALSNTAPAPLTVGEVVVAAGRNRHGATGAFGFVALSGGPWRSRRGGEISQRVWLDLRLMRQSEGAAVLDATGRLRGMAVLGPMRRVLMIPHDTIERAGQELLAHGRIRRGYLGVRVQPVRVVPRTDGSEAEGKAGLMVLGLDPQGPATAVGVLQGDIILAVNGQVPHSPRALLRLLPGQLIGQSVTLDLVRSAATLQIAVIIGEGPAQ